MDCEVSRTSVGCENHAGDKCGMGKPWSGISCSSPAGGTAGAKEGEVWPCFGTSAETLSPHKEVHVRHLKSILSGHKQFLEKSSARGFSRQHGVFGGSSPSSEETLMSADGRRRTELHAQLMRQRDVDTANINNVYLCTLECKHTHIYCCSHPHARPTNRYTHNLPNCVHAGATAPSHHITIRCRTVV